jgi:hypothetical protein
MVAELASGEKRLDDVVILVGLLGDDLAAFDAARADERLCLLGSPPPSALVERALVIDASIAALEREGILKEPALRARYATKVLGPFIRLRERVRQLVRDKPPFWGVFAERETLDLMLDEFAAGRFEAVTALWEALPELTPEEKEKHRVEDLRAEMKALAERARKER